MLIDNIFCDNFDQDNRVAIYTITRMLITDLVNAGYSKEYLYSTIEDFFFNASRPIECNADTVVSFFNCFTFDDVEYEAVFGINIKSKDVLWQGGGSFVYCELAKLNQKYVEDIQTAATDAEIVTIWQNMLKTGFISCKVNPSDIDMNAADFTELSLDDKKRFLMELLDKNQLYVNYCDMEDETFAVSDPDKAFTKSFYGEV